MRHEAVSPRKVASLRCAIHTQRKISRNSREKEIFYQFFWLRQSFTYDPRRFRPLANVPMKQPFPQTCALLLSSLLLVHGCSSSTSSETLIDDPASDELESSTNPVFLPQPAPPYPQSSSSEILSKTTVFQTTYNSFISELFNQFNEVYSAISLGESSSPDPNIALADAEFYDRLLSRCSLGFAMNGVDINEISCPGLVFLDFPYRHPLYGNITVQLQTGILQDDGLTTQRYVLKVFQFSGLREDQLSETLSTDIVLFLSYGILNFL